MIDENKLAELRKTWDAGGPDVHFFSYTDFYLLVQTIEALWKVARAAKEKHLHPEFHRMCSLCHALAALEGKE